MLRVGLTGGIASGKSAVAEMFVELGAALVDTDVVAREVVEPGEPGLEAVRKRFGDEVLDAERRLDRAKMRAIVFDDPERRRALEAILHPLIRARTLERMARAQGPYVIAAVPLLVETGFGEHVDRVLVVDCPEEIQVRRLMRRDGIDEARASAMRRAQIDRRARLAAADDVIDNGGALAETRRQVEALHARYVTLGRGA